MARHKVQVSERAALQRINRRLAEDNLVVRRARSAQMQTSIGHFFVVNLRGNYIDQQDVDLEALGRKVDALKDYEEIAYSE